MSQVIIAPTKTRINDVTITILKCKEKLICFCFVFNDLKNVFIFIKNSFHTKNPKLPANTRNAKMPRGRSDVLYGSSPLSKSVMPALQNAETEWKNAENIASTFDMCSLNGK